MEINSLDWIIWKILQLNLRKDESFSNSLLRPIGCRNTGQFNLSKLEKARKEYELLKEDIRQFDALKNEMLNSPCPIIQLRKNLEFVEKQFREEEAKDNKEREEVQKIIKAQFPDMREKILKELEMQKNKQ
jgi:hypothetical protein